MRKQGTWHGRKTELHHIKRYFLVLEQNISTL